MSVECRGANQDILHLIFPVFSVGVGGKKGDIWTFRNIEVFEKQMRIRRQQMKKEGREGSQIKKTVYSAHILQKREALPLCSPCMWHIGSEASEFAAY